MKAVAVLPPLLVLDPLLRGWLLEDIGRGDRTGQVLTAEVGKGKAVWVAKAPGIITGLPIAARVFQLLSETVSFVAFISEGEQCQPGQVVAEIQGNFDALLMGERVALNLVTRLSGIATLTRKYVEQITDLP